MAKKSPNYISSKEILAKLQELESVLCNISTDLETVITGLREAKIHPYHAANKLAKIVVLLPKRR